MAKTTWKELILKTKDLIGDNFEITIWADHYLYGYREHNSLTLSSKSKWIAMVLMKIIAIWYDYKYNNDFNIYYTMKGFIHTEENPQLKLGAL